MENTDFEVIIIGGSYAGLSAAMSLGRSLRKTLVIDSGKPCNAQTPHSHNFLTQDGRTPKDIALLGKEQVANYPTVQFHDGLAETGRKTENGFEIATATGDTFTAKKLIFATGLKDQMPDIAGYAECWGISVIHCPYCHGYEVKNEKTGILANGDTGFEYAKLISNWTKDLTIFTNGPSELTPEQTEKISTRNIRIVDKPIASLIHKNGLLEKIVFKDQSEEPITAIYSRPAFKQHSAIPEQLGCALTETGLIKLETFQQTTVPGIYAAGDNSHMARSVALAVSSGSMAGALINRELIEEAF
ncbi:NAD(P)/FAD-dependent oxidoreductase [Dyadobacter chenhuakuii]|uniref:NAD(P)/FAD-dependent oxidoreductase n=1 Tax=Dyadobacter chenhuakuii TaxID=2909339 RepID=A0ABY4XM38_9BACT|nr:NAD(P)/FAD-dependent oxidoreductase [Dyadobacter chenhuakuii]MCF2494394.1 NAD(P)/FAD-dependent oxidoreductase [Dyadobacter chenhuakuii]USJ31514.1 NAD(P)/FAD-dependent oxidoreductase [Dyadobacter chenhuakuii]